MAIATINPADGRTVTTFTEQTDAEVEATLARAAERLLRLSAHHLRRAGGLDATGR